MAPKTRGELKVELAKLRKQHYEAMQMPRSAVSPPKRKPRISSAPN